MQTGSVRETTWRLAAPRSEGRHVETLVPLFDRLQFHLTVRSSCPGHIVSRLIEIMTAAGIVKDGPAKVVFKKKWFYCKHAIEPNLGPGCERATLMYYGPGRQPEAAQGFYLVLRPNAMRLLREHLAVAGACAGFEVNADKRFANCLPASFWEATSCEARLSLRWTQELLISARLDLWSRWFGSLVTASIQQLFPGPAVVRVEALVSHAELAIDVPWHWLPVGENDVLEVFRLIVPNVKPMRHGRGASSRTSQGCRYKGYGKDACGSFRFEMALSKRFFAREREGRLWQGEGWPQVLADLDVRIARLWSAFLEAARFVADRPRISWPDHLKGTKHEGREFLVTILSVLEQSAQRSTGLSKETQRLHKRLRNRRLTMTPCPRVVCLNFEEINKERSRRRSASSGVADRHADGASEFR